MALKRISFAALQMVAKENPTAWHQLIAAGTFEPNRMFLNIEAAQERAILEGKSLATERAVDRFRSPLEMARIQETCERCQWNVDWVCEHPGCLPCRQRRSGGLTAHFIDRAFQCPAKKWS